MKKLLSAVVVALALVTPSMAVETVEVDVLKGLKKSTKVEIGKRTCSVLSEGTDSSWLGDNQLTLVIPYTAVYGIDLDGLTAKDIQVSTKAGDGKRVVTIALPPATVTALLQHTSEVKIIANQNPTFRSGSSWRALRDRVIEDSWKQAHALADPGVDEATREGHESIRLLLDRIVKSVDPNCRVEVITKTPGTASPKLVEISTK